MELLEGETLSDRLAKGPLPLEQTLRFGVEIADALDKAHRQGIVHRDLKPGNVMLTKSGVKLLDFGLAKGDDADRNAAVRHSRRCRRSRARLTGRARSSARSSTWRPSSSRGKEADGPDATSSRSARCCTRWRRGRRRSRRRSQASLITAIMSTEPPPISSVQPMSPPALDRVVRTCLAKDPGGPLAERLRPEAGAALDRRRIAVRSARAAGRRRAPTGWLRDRLVGRASSAPPPAVGSNFGAAASLLPRLRDPRCSCRWICRLGKARHRLRLQLRYVIRSHRTAGKWSTLRSGATTELRLRSLDTGDTTTIPGTIGAWDPFFSPDGR